MALRVDGNVRAGPGSALFADDGGADFGNAGVFAGTGHREERGSVSRAFLGSEGYGGAGENIGEHLKPEGAFRAAARDADGIDADAEGFDDIETVLLAVGDAFDQGPDQVCAAMAGGEPDPSAARCGIEVGSAFAH